MARENSFSDENRSLTPDLDEAEEPQSNTVTEAVKSSHVPTTTGLAAAHGLISLDRTTSGKAHTSLRSRFSKSRPSIPLQAAEDGPSPKERFKAAVRKVIAMHRGVAIFAGGARHGIVGDEPGVDPRRPLADATYGHLRVPCEIEVVDYSSVRCTTRKLSNREFVDFMNVESDEPVTREPWVKVRWINIGGLSWDVLKAVGIKYSELGLLSMRTLFDFYCQISIRWLWRTF